MRIDKGHIFAQGKGKVDVMKRYIRVTVVIVVLAALGLGYYYYLSNRTPKQEEAGKEKNAGEVATLISKDIKNNYPESPKEVIKLYARITKAYYNGEITDEQIPQLGAQARLLFDDELKSRQTDDDFYKALKDDISDYKNANRYISDYTIDGSGSVDYTTWNGKKYASLTVLYYVREGSNLRYSYTKYTLREDDKGEWKILYWELVNQESTQSQ